MAGQIVDAYIDKRLCGMDKERQGTLTNWPIDEEDIKQAYPVSGTPTVSDAPHFTK